MSKKKAWNKSYKEKHTKKIPRSKGVVVEESRTRSVPPIRGGDADTRMQ